MSSLTSLGSQKASNNVSSRPIGSAWIKPALWGFFGLTVVAAFFHASLPILKPTHPLHFILYHQRWLLYPHIAAALTAMIIGPLQFSSRLRQRNIARHRLLGKIYVGAVVVASGLAPVMAWNYPAFFRCSALTQGGAWLLCTMAAFLTARHRHIEQHRRWMARSYAVGCAVFVAARLLDLLPPFAHMSLEAGSYAVLFFAMVSIVVADLIVDWRVITSSSGSRSAAQA